MDKRIGEEVRILTGVEKLSLGTDRRLLDSRNVSDHFPLLFRLNI